MSEKVHALFGGPTGLPEPNQNCIEALREWLEMAEAGEIVGFAVVGLCSDHSTRYALGGLVGGYSMVGALEMAKSDIVDGMK